MKKDRLHAFIFVLTALCTPSFLFSQTNTFPTSGNVGIGTLTPSQKLQVTGGKVFIGSPTIIDSYDQLYSAGDNPGFRLEVQRPSGGAAFDFANLYAHKTSATGDALWGKLGILGNFGTSGTSAAPTVTYMYFGTEPTVSYSNNTFRLYPNKNAYFDGNIGIGTTTPGAPLQVGAVNAGVTIGNTSTTTGVLQVMYNTGNAAVRNMYNAGSLTLSGDNNDVGGLITLYARNNPGGVGLTINGGTAYSDIQVRNLTISGSNAFGTATTYVNGGDIVLNGGAKATTGGIDGDIILGNNHGNVGIGTNIPAAKLDINGTTYSRKIYVGTPDANTSNYMGINNLLAVNGTAVFVKAKVATYGSSWPDYVFSSSYKMLSLDSLDHYIKVNKHLPDVPSEKDVQKEGLDLGANQATLLKKIEELTLIVIEQNKKQQELEKKVDEQEAEIKAFLKK